MGSSSQVFHTQYGDYANQFLLFKKSPKSSFHQKHVLLLLTNLSHTFYEIKGLAFLLYQSTWLPRFSDIPPPLISVKADVN